MKLHWFMCVVATMAYHIHAQGTCNIISGSGVCKPIEDCTELNEKVNLLNRGRIRQSERHKVRYDYHLRKQACSNGQVCCSDCKTPEGKSGVTKLIKECPHLLQMLRKNDVEYIQKVRINNTNMACCGPPPPSKCESSFSSLPDPATKCCGRDTNNSPRIIGGQTAHINQFPWAVLLEYVNSLNEISATCGGSLVTNRHVVTAAHCFRSRHGPPKNVRVGDFDKGNTGPDCEYYPDGSKKCNDLPQSIPIEAYMKHPQYEPVSVTNDIGLIRLRTPVKYTEYVRPICLPSMNYLNTKEGTKFVVTGWGRGANKTNANKKQFLEVNFVNPTACQQAFFYLYSSMEDNQICAGGEVGKDSCRGDSGGPLMAQGVHHELVGVVSSGHPTCGTPGKPGIYANVYHYIDWIRQHILNDSQDWIRL